MTDKKMQLLIPVENQVRELDPKLLLACIAAQRGFSSVIGSRREMEFNINSFPPAIYLSKSMTVRSLLFFRVAHRFGHEIVTWDEEALVHLPPETYFSRRLNPAAIQYVSHLFAWGQDNADLWRRYPGLPADVPIHVTGNPRSDMLRPELRDYYQQEVEQFRETYGKFILINTNFNHVNAYGSDMNLFKPTKLPGQAPQFGRAARGMSREYAEGLRDHKQAIFEGFKQLFPRLEKAFPDHNIVVRPHPTENHEIYQQIAAGCSRMQVTNEGNVVPWLLASQAVIHNGCTTGVEAYVMGTPAISYRPTVNNAYDDGFYRLPNKISHQCFSFEQLQNLLGEILEGRIGTPNGDEREKLLGRHLAARQGQMACERMVDILDQIAQTSHDADRDSMTTRLKRWALGKGLQLARGIKSSLPGSHNRPEFQRHRFPAIALEEIKAKVARFHRLLGIKEEPKIKQESDVMFRIN
jgi:surface carbohydrate biosynthesis protein